MYALPQGFVLVIVPDGCRRQFEPSIAGIKLGHQKGLENLHDILEYARELTITNSVVWGASEANLRDRTPQEVEHLFQLFEGELEHQLRKRDAHISVCGRWQLYVQSQDQLHRLTRLVHELQQATGHVRDHRLTVLFGYDGRMEIAAAVQESMLNGIPFGAEQSDVWEILVRESWTAHIPRGNLLIIRTGIEKDSHESDLLLPFQRQNAEVLHDTGMLAFLRARAS